MGGTGAAGSGAGVGGVGCGTGPLGAGGAAEPEELRVLRPCRSAPARAGTGRCRAALGDDLRFRDRLGGRHLALGLRCRAGPAGAPWLVERRRRRRLLRGELRIGQRGVRLGLLDRFVHRVVRASGDQDGQPDGGTGDCCEHPAAAERRSQRRGRGARVPVGIPVGVTAGIAAGSNTDGGIDGGAKGIEGDGRAARHAVGKSGTAPTRGSALAVAEGAGQDARQTRSSCRSSCSGSVRSACPFTVPPSLMSLSMPPA